MLGKILVVIAVIAGFLLTVILNTTTPASAGAFGILAVFGLTYLMSLSLITFLLWGLSHLVSYVTTLVVTRRPVERMSLKRAYFYATIIAIAPVIILSMQSVGGVGAYEFGLIVLLIAIGCLYVTKRTPR